MIHKKKTQRNSKWIRMMAFMLILSMLVNLFCFSGDARANEKKKEWSGEGYRIEMTDTSACNDGCTVNAIVSNDSQEEI